MYKQGLSLANIKRAMSGGEGNPPPAPGADANQTGAPTGVEQNQAGALTGMEQNLAGALTGIANKEAIPTGEVSKIRQVVRSIINSPTCNLSFIDKFAANAKNDREDSQGSDVDQSITRTVSNYIIVTIYGLIITWITFTTSYYYKNIYQKRKANNTEPQNRYNKDLPEYEIARTSNRLINIRSGLFQTVLLPILIFVLTVIVIIISQIRGSPIYKRVTHIWGIAIISSVTAIVYTTVYISEMRKIKQISLNISKFENFVYERFYRTDLEFLNKLYNEGKSPDNVDSIITEAAKAAILNKTIDISNTHKILYTLSMYKFLMGDIDTNNIYRTESLELFNTKKINIPGKSRIFRVADYMRAEKTAETDKINVDDLFATMNTYQKLVSQKTVIKDVKNDLDQTRKMAFKIGAKDAWKSFDKMLKTVFALVLFTVVFLVYILARGVLAMGKVIRECVNS